MALCPNPSLFKAKKSQILSFLSSIKCLQSIKSESLCCAFSGYFIIHDMLWYAVGAKMVCVWTCVDVMGCLYHIILQNKNGIAKLICNAIKFKVKFTLGL